MGVEQIRDSIFMLKGMMETTPHKTIEEEIERCELWVTKIQEREEEDASGIIRRTKNNKNGN